MSGEEFERAIGYRFKNQALLAQALTHRSVGSQHNERLEFLGDSLLNFVIARLLYEQFASLPEGDLSRLRANLVNQQALAGLAVSMNLGSHLKLGEGELKSGGFRRPSILADAFEAVLGAIYLDGGFEAAEAALIRVYRPLLENENLARITKDSKTQLQELLQARRFGLPHYEISQVRGEAHMQLFRVSCRIAELDILAEGEGLSRRAAEQAAAHAAMDLVAARK
ncbi:MAG: ribonuclease III [Burkholderiales bacterium]